MPEPAAWHTTLRQILPRLPSILRQMRPTYRLDGVAALDAEFFRRQGIEGVIWDVDGTLMAHHATRVHEQVVPAFEALLNDGDFRHAILSNCGEERYQELGELFPTIPVLRVYAATDDRPEDADRRVVHRVLLEGNDSLGVEAAQRLVESGATPIRKPSATLVDLAVQTLGCTREKVVIVGDQYTTDIATANLVGVMSMKVPTLAPESFPRAVRVSQILENAVYRIMYGRA